MTQPKILLLDIETSFHIGAVWQCWGQNINPSQMLMEKYILCWSGAWMGEDDVISDSLHWHPEAYEEDPHNDFHVVQSLQRHLDAADIVVAHNGRRFDIPMINNRMITHGMQPPSAYTIYDTLAAARRNFKFPYNKLDCIAEKLKVGRKLDTDFDLWKDIVLYQDTEAFDRMVEYCEQDVEILEQVYLKLRPWDAKHPSTVVAATDDETMKCNSCGSTHIVKNGSWNTQTQTYQKYKCQSCGHNMRSRKADPKTREEKAILLRSI